MVLYELFKIQLHNVYIILKKTRKGKVNLYYV